ncbi:hypothetical protein DUNSADRAFT_10154 [Dunaliella salina]|uniref:Uncharacterized protein n=1 Tax=Dunaliella salina TaxID=3046 RepID=A0ABQ7GG15_DUNSA|nr:hypothetical protein DUNSADRAFT_10154 [Dunaliella salina]|eukprot:KAF5833541.1 hypothetical protein DUNSADRAFT_10154 [Dunaliella salina]
MTACKFLALFLGASCFLVRRPTEAVPVGTGEAFVEAVKEFGLEGGQVLLELDTSGPISVANASWSPKEQNAGFTKGSLIIQAAPAQNGGGRGMAIFDAAMRSGLSPAVGMEAEVLWQDVVIYNLCSRMLPFKPPEIYQLSQDNQHLLPRGRQLQNYERKNSVVYHPYQGLLAFINWLAGGQDTNVTFRATNNPNDPWGLSLPEFGGDHMPHRFCAPDGSATGPLVSPENVFKANFTFAPTWLISSSEQLSKLDSVSEWGINPPRINGKLPPALVVFVNDTFFASSSGRATNSTLLRRDTYLHG